MNKTILTIGMALGITFAHAQVNQNLENFISMLTVKNLNSKTSKLQEIKGTVLTTWEMYSTSDKEYYISKVDLANLQSVKWTSKQEYDELYPEDKSINKDADFISLFFKPGDVERNSFFTETGTNVRKTNEGYTETAAQWPNCNFLNITFNNSTLAVKAKKYLDAYIASQTK